MMLLYGMCEHFDCNLRNNAGYCQATVCMNPHYSGWRNKEVAINNGRNVNPDELKEAVEQYRKQHMTNSDWVRALTDEDFVDFITGDYCEMLCGDPPKCPGSCKGVLLEWLKRPVEKP